MKIDIDVVFIGGCDQDRVPYMEALIKSIPSLRLRCMTMTLLLASTHSYALFIFDPIYSCTEALFNF